jgi:BlaI family penicillinase repressor
MGRTPREITDAELAVLRVLWESQPATIRELTTRLYPCYATVQKLLERLEEKGFVKRDREKTGHRFCSRVCREELIGRRLRMVAKTLCGGSMTPLLTHLLRVEKLSASERRRLRELINRRANDGGKKRLGPR